MKRLSSRKVFGILVLALVTMLSVSSDVMGQGRGRRVSHMDRKCAKFVNCHDASEGRWDGRGPNRRTSLTDRIFRRHRRDRDFDRGRRWRHRDRDFDRAHSRRWRR